MDIEVRPSPWSYTKNEQFGAFIVDEPLFFGLGRSHEEAIGDLILRCREKFDIKIKHPGG